MDIPLQALHEVHTMQRQPRHQASHPRAVSDSTAAEGGLYPAPEGPAQGHTGPAPGSVSGSQGKPWEHPAAPVSAETGPWGIAWEGEGMALLHLSPRPRSLPSCCFLPVDDRWSGDAKAEVLLIRRSPRSSGPVVLILRSLSTLSAAPPGSFIFNSHASKVERHGTCMLPQSSVD